MGIQVITGKINLSSLSQGDTLINPSDRGLSGSGGLDLKVHSMGGRAMREVCDSAGVLCEGDCFVTDGYETGAGKIIHAVVPEQNGTRSLTDLRDCYRRCLGRAYGRRILIPLLGVGSRGWSPKDSLECAWSESVRYLSGKTSDIEKFEIQIFCTDRKLTDQYKKRKSRAFFKQPERWWTRGDIYYWNFLMRYFDSPSFISLDLHGFIKEMEKITWEKCGCGISEHMNVYIEEFAHGGMSSGYISGFWATEGIPFLCSRMCQLGLDGIRHKTMIEYSFKGSITGESHTFRLPAEILPDLKRLE